jgi:23S rRNA (cytosine1962-C5)-methyltransferase
LCPSVAAAGAPWAFSNELALDASVKALPPGTLVELAAEDGTPIGAGYFNAKSLIAVRLLGKPETEFDVAFFTDRLRRARGLREAFFTEPYYRLVHAEGDRLPGVV